MPGVNVSFLSGRALLFEALAKIAFSIRHDYWGWRFAAWSCHYFQDITQPYHAKAFPPSLSSILGAYKKKQSGQSLKEWIGDFLRVRHVMSEATTHFLMNTALLKRKSHPLLDSLKGSAIGTDSGLDKINTRAGIPAGDYDLRHVDNVATPSPKSHQEVMFDSSLVAVNQAGVVDDALGKLIDDLGLNDLTYSPGEGIYREVADRLTERIDDLPSLDLYVDSVIPCLREAGKATRFVVKSFADIL